MKRTINTLLLLALTFQGQFSYGALSAPDLAQIGTPKNYFVNGGFERGTSGASAYFDGGTVTFSNGSSTITYTTGSNDHLAIGNVVNFTTTGTLPTNFSASTNYYVVSVPSSTTFTVSATQGGTAISAGSAGSGTHTFHAKYPIYGGGMGTAPAARSLEPSMQAL